MKFPMIFDESCNNIGKINNKISNDITLIPNEISNDITQVPNKNCNDITNVANDEISNDIAQATQLQVLLKEESLLIIQQPP